MGFFNSLGLISGLASSPLGIISFATNHLPSHHAAGTSVQVKAGRQINLNGGVSNYRAKFVDKLLPELILDKDGGVKDIFGFDLDNVYIGKASGHHINSGGAPTFTLDQRTPDAQADYVDVTFTNNNICVAWISVRMHDRTVGGGWTGDVGKHCGQHWHKSNPAAGTKKQKDGGGVYRPACTWFDGDLSGSTKAGGLKFKTRAYGADSHKTKDQGKGCASTEFSNNNKVISGKPGKRAIDDPRPAWIENQLIVSEHPDDKDAAAELCNSETSWGQDFLAHGKFCEMGTKTLYSVCEFKNTFG